MSSFVLDTNVVQTDIQTDKANTPTQSKSVLDMGFLWYKNMNIDS